MQRNTNRNNYKTAGDYDDDIDEGDIDDGSTSSEEKLLDSGLYCDFPSRRGSSNSEKSGKAGKSAGKSAGEETGVLKLFRASTGSRTGSSVSSKGSSHQHRGVDHNYHNYDRSSSFGAGGDNCSLSGASEGERSVGGAIRRGSYNFFNSFFGAGAGAGGGTAATGLSGSSLKDSLKDELGSGPSSSAPVNSNNRTVDRIESMNNPSDAMDVTSSASNKNGSGGGKPKSSKPRRRRGSHMMPEGMKMPTSAELMQQKAAAAAAAAASEPMDMESTPTAAVSMKPTTYRMMPRSVPPMEGGGVSQTTATMATTVATSATTATTATMATTATSATTSTTATTMKAKGNKPRRRRGSHMMPEGHTAGITAASLTKATNAPSEGGLGNNSVAGATFAAGAGAPPVTTATMTTSTSTSTAAPDTTTATTATTMATTAASSTKTKSTKPRRRRGSHMMPEGGARMPTSAELMQQKAAAAAATGQPTSAAPIAATTTTITSSATPTPTYATPTPTTTTATTTATTATTATTMKVKGNKPRRRRGSHMMPEGAMGGMAGGAQAHAHSATTTPSAPQDAPMAVSNRMGGGGGGSTAASSTQYRSKYVPPPPASSSSSAADDGGGDENMDDADSSPTTTTTSATASTAGTATTSTTTTKAKPKKPGRRRGSHMMPEGQMQKLTVSPQSSMNNMAYNAAASDTSAPMDMSEEDDMRGSGVMTGMMRGMTRGGAEGHSRRESNEIMAEPDDDEGVEVSAHGAAQTIQTHQPHQTHHTHHHHHNVGGPTSTSQYQPHLEAYHDANASDSSASKPTGHTRARRRGSVVKSMLGGEKNVDGDGERYAQASSNVANTSNVSNMANIAYSQSTGTGNTGNSGTTDNVKEVDMMNVDSSTHLPQRRSSQGGDNEEAINKKPMLKQPHHERGSPGGAAVYERGPANEGEGKRMVRKKDIGRKAIRSVAGELDYVHKVVPKSNDAKELIYDAIKPNILFRACSPEELVDLVDAFEPQYLPKGSIVIREGDEGDHFYVMERGGVDVYEKDVHKCSLYSGVAFGEIALLYGCPRSATVQAKYDCKLWVIDRRAFRGITAQHKRKRLELKLNFLKKVKIHDKVLGEILQPHEIHSMALATKTEKFRNGSAIVRQGERGDAFYMIEEGTVDVFIREKGDRPVVTLKSGQFFGEKALLSSDVRTATCIASSDVKCMLLMREDFVLMLGNLQDLLDRSYIARDEALRAEQEAMRMKEAHPVAKRFDMNDFDIKRTLGVGAFGFVKLVKWNQAPRGNTDTYYALKCVSKQKIEEHKQQEKIKNEEAIMKELVHPFIARCYSVMEDEKGKYFLMEALCGGELCELLYHESQFSEGWSMFYSASVLTAFAHMHERKIAYRDLKPENLVLNTNGFVKIVDFGLAKKITSGQTYTFCGTPDYLAPEVILNEGYDWAVDYWGLGVLIYEMTAGVAPFFAESPMETYEKVLSGHVYIPGHFSRALANLIKKLLHTSQSKRLGRTVGGATTVMCHPWYSGFDWDALMEYRLRVPYIPEEKDPDDNSAAMEESEAEGFATAFF